MINRILIKKMCHNINIYIENLDIFDILFDCHALASIVIHFKCYID